jgi:hypothetical protein
MKILPYKMGSQSARKLRDAFSTRVLLKKDNTPVTRRNSEVILNWGHSSPKFSIPANVKVINHPDAVKLSSDKLSSLQALAAAGVNTPKFTTSYDEALGWIRDGRTVMCRTLLRSHSGKGIVMAQSEEQLVSAPLYTRYFRKDNEFRVHVFMGKVIDYTEKKAKLDRGPNYNKFIRSNANGWVYCRENILLLDEVKDQAMKAVAALGLDFGAVDVMWNGSKAVVLEVNTAPGLCDTTAQKYVQALKENNLYVERPTRNNTSRSMSLRGNSLENNPSNGDSEMYALSRRIFQGRF